LRALAAEATPAAHPDWCDAERRFDAALHQAVAIASGNARLHQEINRYLNLFQLVRHQVARSPDRHAVGHFERLAVLEALEAHDAARSAKAMTEHIAAALQAM